MRIILDNIIYCLQKNGGISVYWGELTKRFLANTRRNLFFVEQENVNYIRQSLNIPHSFILKELLVPIFILRYFPLTLQIKEKTIFHSSYYRFSLSRNAINIVTIHDFTYEYFRKGVPKVLHHLQKWMAIKHADGIICISENTKKDLFYFFPNIAAKKRIKVIYNGVSQSYHPQIIKSLNGKLSFLNGKKIILFVGTRIKYKNFNLAVDAINLLSDYTLVIIGGDKLKKKEIDYLNLKLYRRYFHFLYLEESELNILYNIAHCLLYPSGYEGFGIPIVEAMKAGCPVVTTNKSAIPEVAGDVALMVKNMSPDEFVKKIFLLENKERREEIKLKGFEQAKKFNWDKCADEVIKFYQELYDNK